MTYYAAFAEEFKSIGAKSRLALSGQDLRDFATSPFFRTVRGFYQYRVCAAGYMSVVLVVSLVFCIFDMDGSINLYLIYYTRWSLLTVVVYLILAARITRDYALLRGEPLGDTGGGALLLCTFLRAAVSFSSHGQCVGNPRLLFSSPFFAMPR